MLRFIIKRLLITIPTILVVITITWGLIRLAPGNFYTGEKTTAARHRAEYSRKVWPRQTLVRTIPADYVGHRPTSRLRNIIDLSGPVSKLDHRPLDSHLSHCWFAGLPARAAHRHHHGHHRGAETQFTLGLRLDGHGDAGNLNSELRAGTNPRSDFLVNSLLAAAVTLGRLSQQEHHPAGHYPRCDLHSLHRTADEGGNARGAWIRLHSHGARRRD